MLLLHARAPEPPLDHPYLLQIQARFIRFYIYTLAFAVRMAAMPEHLPKKAALVDRMMSLKEESGKTYTQIGNELGLSNVYTAQLLMHQQQLKPETAPALKKALPGISDTDLLALQKAPSRRWDPQQIQDPVIYRLHEATMLAGEAIKGVINEEFDDGIMSAINLHAHVDKVTGKEGEERVVITMSGKFLPYIEQRIQDDVTRG